MCEIGTVAALSFTRQNKTKIQTHVKRFANCRFQYESGPLDLTASNDVRKTILFFLTLPPQVNRVHSCLQLSPPLKNHNIQICRNISFSFYSGIKVSTLCTEHTLA